MQIGKRVIVHGLVEIDRVENLDSVICMHKCMANLEQGRTFRKRFVNTENDNSLKNELFLWCTALEIACCHFLTD